MAEEAGVSEQDLLKMRQLREERNNPKVQPTPQIAEKVRLKVTVAKDSDAGVRELRVMTSRGLSNPIRFDVGESPEHLESEPNDSSPDAAIDGLPVVVNGQILPGDVDRFSFEARRGQRLVVATSARELIPYLADAVPGWFQATLALYDSEGDEVAYVDDFQFHPDPALFYEIPKDGTYTLEIKDSVYRGREDFVYRIALGELPFVTSVFPLGGRTGEKTRVEMEGWNLAKTTISVDNESAASGEVPLDSTSHRGNKVPFDIDTLPECLEQEPNGREEDATPIDFPTIVNGRIDHPGDWDLFRFEGRKGETIVAEVVARRLGSPLDSILELTDAEGKQFALNDDHEDKAVGMTTHHADSRVSIALPADGLYTLRLGDRQQGGSSGHAYRLRISRERPDFELRVVPASVNVRAGGTAPLTVYVVRRDGFDGDIALSLKNAPRGMTLGGGWIPAGQDQVRLTVSAPPFARETVVSLGVEGIATIDGQEVRRLAVPAEDMMQAFIYQHLVPAEEQLVSIRKNPRGPGSIRLLGDGPVEIPMGGTTVVRLAAPAGPLASQSNWSRATRRRELRSTVSSSRKKPRCWSSVPTRTRRNLAPRAILLSTCLWSDRGHGTESPSRPGGSPWECSRQSPLRSSSCKRGWAKRSVRPIVEWGRSALVSVFHGSVGTSGSISATRTVPKHVASSVTIGPKPLPVSESGMVMPNIHSRFR